MENAHIAAAFEELADLLELAGESPSKTRAYRTFAQTLRDLEESASAIAARGELAGMSGVGKAIAQKVVELAATGTCGPLERARAAVPTTLRDLLGVPGLGVKSVRLVWKETGVTTLAELLYACEENRLAPLPGFGPKKQARTLVGARALLRGSSGVLLAAALDVGSILEAALRSAGAREVAITGDARRGIELVRELVLLAHGISAKKVAAVLTGVDALGGGTATIDEASPRGAPFRAAPASHVTDVRVVVHATLPVRVRVVEDSWIHARITTSSDPAHVRWLEGLASVRSTMTGGALAEACGRASSEEALYAALGTPFVPAELRTGAAPHVPAELVANEHVGGIFHVHTDWSDGTASILEMARAAVDAGFAYIGISDHSRAASYANGLDAARLEEQRAAITIARLELPSCAILHGIEVDILPDGALDLDDATLASLDFVIASVHSRMGMGSSEMTKRIVRAVSHPLVTILGHPTGRLLLGRKGYGFDMAEVARAAAANGTYLEINANAQRLDLEESKVRRAAAEGARFAIDPDAHATRGLSDTRLGVTMARRAGLTVHQLLNARDRPSIERLLADRKAEALTRLRA